MSTDSQNVIPKDQLGTICNDLASSITERISQSSAQPFFVFVGGGRAMGKSTIAAALQKLLPGSAVISEDYYILSPSKLEEANIHIEDPKAKDSALLRRHIEMLKAGEVIRIPVEGPLAVVPGLMYVDPHRFPIIIIEGTGVFGAEYDSLRDYSIFVECSEPLAEKRFVDRCLLNPERNPFLVDPQFPKEHDPAAITAYFRQRVLPFYEGHFRYDAQKADQVILNEGSHFENLIKIEFPNGRTFFMKAPTAEDMNVRKGSVAKQSYGDLFFGGIFQARTAVSPAEFLNRYQSLLGPIHSTQEEITIPHIVNRVFDHPDAMTFLKTSSKDMPFLWKSQPDIRRGLKWADSAIKLAVETISPNDSVRKFQQAAGLISDVIKLHSSSSGFFIFDTMDVPSFMRLINIAVSLVCRQPPMYIMQADPGLMVRNLANLRACIKLGLAGSIDISDRGRLKELIKLAAYAGIVFPSENAMSSGDADKAERDISAILRVAHRERLGIDHSDRLIEILRTARMVTILLDDNGECIPDLLFFQDMVNDNPACIYNFLINKNQVGVNLRAGMLKQILDYPEFSSLKRAFAVKRCVIIEEESTSESLSYELLSKAGRAAVDQSDMTYIKGQLFFETFNNKSRHTAYVFVPSSSTAIAYCGHTRGGVVFVCDKDCRRIEVDQYGVVTKKLGVSS